MKLTPIITENPLLTLNANETYKFLKKEAERLETDQSEVQSPVIKKIMINNLNSLLNEVSLTPDPKQRSQLLDKIENWYNSKVPKDQSQSVKLSPKEKSFTPKTPQPSMYINQSQLNSLSPIKNIEKTRCDPISNINYLKHIRRSNKYQQDLEDNESRENEESVQKKLRKKRQYKNMIVKPDLEWHGYQTKCFDFSKDALNLPLIFAKRHYEQMSEIENIKRALARKKLTVSSKCLEDGVSLYLDRSLNLRRNYPESGELLLSIPKSQSVKTTKKNRKKKTKKLK